MVADPPSQSRSPVPSEPGSRDAAKKLRLQGPGKWKLPSLLGRRYVESGDRGRKARDVQAPRVVGAEDEIGRSGRIDDVGRVADMFPSSRPPVPARRATWHVAGHDHARMWLSQREAGREGDAGAVERDRHPRVFFIGSMNAPVEAPACRRRSRSPPGCHTVCQHGGKIDPTSTAGCETNDVVAPSVILRCAPGCAEMTKARRAGRSRGQRRLRTPLCVGRGRISCWVRAVIRSRPTACGWAIPSGACRCARSRDRE